MTKIKDGKVEVISISLAPEILEAIDKLSKLGIYGNRSMLINRAILEFLKREVVKLEETI